MIYMARAVKGSPLDELEDDDNATYKSHTWHNITSYVITDVSPKHRPPNGGRIVSIRIADIQHMIDLDIPDEWDVVFIMDEHGNTVDSFRAPVWKDSNTKLKDNMTNQTQTEAIEEVA